jgi:hypothetical protein
MSVGCFLAGFLKDLKIFRTKKKRKRHKLPFLTENNKTVRNENYITEAIL